ncbi:phage holin [Oceanobacillus profundus]|uniref:Phage holin n=1 Tax=Oceanobacillus profundus TaxID=372463 RepID=A0A417YJR8_9BACI|nr:phage holin [Oceanobacillus profundus]RHW33508.1 phage holin [Oceanobacillus profundus]
MDKGTLIRTVVLVIALINQFLVTADLNPIPGSETLWGEIVSMIFTGIAAATAWFKNNYVTWKGKRQKEVLQRNQLIK